MQSLSVTPLQKRKGGPTRIDWDSMCGHKFARLLVLKLTGKNRKYEQLCDAQCECGVVRGFNLASIRNGDVLSCGCLIREMLKLPTSQRLKVARRPSRPQPWEKKKKWVQKNRAKMRVVAKRFRERHPVKIKEGKAAYYQRAKPKIYAKAKHRFSTDEMYRLEAIVRGRIRKALRIQKAIKSKRILELLGCSLEEFRAHLQSLFTEGMSWDEVRLGRIHIDHVVPIRAFDLRDPAQQSVAFNFKNHQPLWKTDNLKKSDKLPDGRSARLIIRRPNAPTSSIPVPLA